jgi:tuberculosinol/isotuberculosinol synthase
VRRAKSHVCVFPINGTRRWFILEHPDQAEATDLDAYLQIAGQRHIELYQLFFDHGIDTLLTPIFGPDLLDRGKAYRQMMIPALLWFAQNPEFIAFYEAYDVRVRVYGDARRYFQGTPYESALDAFDELSRRTASHTRHRLFFGVCAHDPSETIAQIGAEFHARHGHTPSKRQIVEAYYGEYVEPVDLFIGFDRPAAFDMPLIATGSEDLYFTVSPSPYMDAQTLRTILYDHLYARQIDESSYDALSVQDIQLLASFYKTNRRHVLGIGRRHKSGAFWYPTPQVEAMPELLDA